MTSGSSNDSLPALVPAMDDVDCPDAFFVDQRVTCLRHRILARSSNDSGFAHARILFENTPRAIYATFDELRSLWAVLGNMSEAVDELARSGRRPIKRLFVTWHGPTVSLRPHP